MVAKLLFTFFAGASAFMLAPLAARRAPLAATMGVEDVAATCLEEGCSVDTLSDLMAELKAESKEIAKRNAQILFVLGQLEALTKNPEANKGEIEKVVAAASRSFSVVEAFNFPGEALGYTGTPGKTTAGKEFA